MILEFECVVLSRLEFDLIVHHGYRDLAQYGMSSVELPSLARRVFVVFGSGVIIFNWFHQDFGTATSLFLTPALACLVDPTHE